MSMLFIGRLHTITHVCMSWERHGGGYRWAVVWPVTVHNAVVVGSLRDVV
jgi:hypothetical protein